MMCAVQMKKRSDFKTCEVTVQTHHLSRPDTACHVIFGRTVRVRMCHWTVRPTEPNPSGRFTLKIETEGKFVEKIFSL
jgi:hypothetical protein